MLSESQVIDIFKALADPNRLTLFRLLLASDLTNSELMDKTGLRQNLLSHHLNILVESGLVRVQRSIGDARRHYFSVNLEQAGQFAAWWERHGSCALDRRPVLPALSHSRRVLFLCRRNSARSLMAEALARGERVVYASPDKSGAARMVEMVRQEADRLKKANP